MWLSAKQSVLRLTFAQDISRWTTFFFVEDGDSYGILRGCRENVPTPVAPSHANSPAPQAPEASGAHVAPEWYP
jgi:hypothetical protein